jgi:elongation factor Ts
MAESAPSVTTEQIRELREKTGGGVMECKKALTEAGGKLDEALKILRAKGASVAAAKASRATSQGLIGSYVHGGKIGVMVEVNCETDFVARTEQFQNLVHEICLQIASMNPSYISEEEMPADLSAVEKKHLKERLLLEQPYVKDSSKTIQDLLHEAVTSLRENLRIRRFSRYTLGEEVASNTPSSS